ncbi:MULTISPECIES: hypothetical protein [Flavobacterium]|uniref:hypothetical protein n=1 Tax=Flavobacterium TaxID=237 RepID=UPI001FCCABD6|nr:MULTISPECIES: hypothetical protein [Flavobacterium]UOK41615.1 hypothetical protein LZF87_09860 [Flavobacterium enshiense]
MKLLKSIFSLLSSPKNTHKQTDGEVLKIQKEGAQHAIELAKVFSYKLNYSDESLKNVDKVLIKLNKEYIGTKNEHLLPGFAMAFGLYIIEVFEKNHEQGYLKRQRNEFGEDTFPYYWRKNLIYPCMWCLERIFDDKASDVSLKYNSIISEE